MDFTINGKPLSALRVVDLKVELEKRGLPKSGNKTDLIERLSHYLIKQAQNQNEFTGDSQSEGKDVGPGAQPPNMSLSHGLTDNDFVRDYLKLRETQFASALSDQDAHLQSTKTEETDVMDQQIPGNVKSRNLEASMVGGLKSPNPVDREKHSKASLDMGPIQLSVSSSSTTPDKQIQYIDQPRATHDGTIQKAIQAQDSSTAVDIGSVPPTLSQCNSQIEDKEVVGRSNLKQIPESISVSPKPGEKEKDSPPVADILPEHLETSTSDMCEENLELNSSRNNDTKGVLKESDVEKEPVAKSKQNIPSITENAATPECDEIVVSNSPILPDFEETVDEEKNITSKTNSESISEPPPPDTTFRKLSRQVSNDGLAEDQKKKKRQWGKKDSKETDQEDVHNAEIVSGELLKDIVPDVKPYLEDLSKEDELDHEQETEEEEVNGEEPETKTQIAEEHSTESVESRTEKSPTQQTTECLKPHVPPINKARKGSLSNLNPERSCVIEVRNLVRPFTLIQFKELLLRTGKISNFEDGGFWIDKIKSHAIIEYSSPEDADETVMALDGTKWPSTNPKMLTATFSTKKVLVKANTDNDVPLRSNLNKDNYRRVSSKDESEDLFRKRKHSETQSEAAGGLYYEESAQGKRIRNSSEKEAGTEEKSDSPKPKKHLDDLFRKTKALPCIYWMPKQLKDSKS